MSFDVAFNMWTRGLLVAAAAWLSVRAGVRLSAATRSWLCGLALLAVAADTAATFAFGSRASAGDFFTMSPLATSLAAPAWMAGLTAVWACGTFASLLWLAVSWQRIGVFKRRSLPVSRERIETLPIFAIARRRRERTARVRMSADVATVQGLGGRHPIIAVAPDFAERVLDVDLDRLLAREQCRLDRRDDWMELANRVFLACSWLSPAAWVLSRLWRLQRDAACDEAVAALRAPIARRREARIFEFSQPMTVASLLLVVFVISRTDASTPTVAVERSEAAMVSDVAPETPEIAPAVTITEPEMPAPVARVAPQSEYLPSPSTPEIEAEPNPPALSPAPESDFADLIRNAMTPADLALPPASSETVDAVNYAIALPPSSALEPAKSRGIGARVAKAGAATGGAVVQAGAATAGAVAAAGKETASFFKWIGGAFKKIGG